MQKIREILHEEPPKRQMTKTATGSLKFTGGGQKKSSYGDSKDFSV